MKKILLIIIIFFIVTKLQAQGWGQTQKIVPDDRALADQFGWSVAMQDDVAVIGARSDDGNSSDYGSVYVYVRDVSNNWIQTQKLVSSDVRQFDFFGTSVDIDGNFIIVGARGQDYDENNANFENAEGAAYIFEKDGSGNWNEVQKLVASDRGQTFQAVFGETVAISGDYAVVNMPTASSSLGINAGVCYVFERDTNGVWNEVQKITNSHRTNDDRFGDFSISISGSLMAIGARQQDYDASGQNEILSAGAVYIFERDANGIWNEIQKIVASDREQGEWFGRSVAIDDNQIIVGASQEYSQGNSSAQYGAVYVFERDGNGIYNEIQKIRPDALIHQSKFGHSIALDNNKLIVGAHFMNIGAVNFGGAAFMFEKDGNGIWNQTAEMYDVDVNSGDDFGFDVAISNDFAFVGAFEQDEDDMGLNFLSQAGAAYVFDLNEPNTLPSLKTLSIAENSLEHAIKAYPNPVVNTLIIDFEKNYEAVNVSVYNALGQEVFSKMFQNILSAIIPFNLSKGLYLVKVKTRDNKNSTLKILKE